MNILSQCVVAEQDVMSVKWHVNNAMENSSWNWWKIQFSEAVMRLPMEKSTQRGKSELTNNAKTETRQKHFFFSFYCIMGCKVRWISQTSRLKLPGRLWKLSSGFSHDCVWWCTGYLQLGRDEVHLDISNLLHQYWPFKATASHPFKRSRIQCCLTDLCRGRLYNWFRRQRNQIKQLMHWVGRWGLFFGTVFFTVCFQPC